MSDDLPTVTLSKDERYYLLPQSPVPLPRVSTILDHTAKPGIRAWEKKVGFEEAERIKLVATTFGSRVHALTERIDRGEEFEVEADLIPWAVAWRAFVEEYVEEWVYIEHFIYSLKYGYAGTADRVAVMKKTHHLAIIDLKTSKYPSDDYGVQTSAYYGGLYEMEELRVQERIAAFLPSNKPYQYALDYFDDLNGDWAEFIRRRDSWLRFREKEDYWKKRLRFVKCEPMEELESQGEVRPGARQAAKEAAA
jgi:hypothetical protein